MNVPRSEGSNMATSPAQAAQVSAEKGSTSKQHWQLEHDEVSVCTQLLGGFDSGTKAPVMHYGTPFDFHLGDNFALVVSIIEAVDIWPHCCQKADQDAEAIPNTMMKTSPHLPSF